ncbi:chemotaxis protein CheW [Dictyobacter aurantiacus]|uniref:CheW-like domain-containing protein n=1 Tax=Dictyobacter aurantiacus TaxID=1936993 RepID=A0A401ZDL7_9CHLR|nr:chemotaxis protein CheW [Dictyobacter aurantiacus]GCE04981.1 hypothetical protein KDAU_23100 [Dictyobacter aurantiacus]
MSQRPALSTALLRGNHARHLEQLSDQDFWKYAQQLAQAPQLSTPQTEEYVKCAFEAGHALIPLAVLREILPTTRYLAQLPASPHWMLGIAAWRGEPIAVIDLAAYLAQQSTGLPGHPVLLIVQLADITLGLATTISDAPAFFASEQDQASNNTAKEDWSLPEHSVQGTYAGMPILQLPAIISDIVQQLRISHE